MRVTVKTVPSGTNPAKIVPQKAPAQPVEIRLSTGPALALAKPVTAIVVNLVKDVEGGYKISPQALLGNQVVPDYTATYRNVRDEDATPSIIDASIVGVDGPASAVPEIVPKDATTSIKPGESRAYVVKTPQDLPAGHYVINLRGQTDLDAAPYEEAIRIDVRNGPTAAFWWTVAGAVFGFLFLFANDPRTKALQRIARIRNELQAIGKAPGQIREILLGQVRRVENRVQRWESGIDHGTQLTALEGLTDVGVELYGRWLAAKADLHALTRDRGC